MPSAWLIGQSVQYLCHLMLLYLWLRMDSICLLCSTGYGTMTSFVAAGSPTEALRHRRLSHQPPAAPRAGLRSRALSAGVASAKDAIIRIKKDMVQVLGQEAALFLRRPRCGQGSSLCPGHQSHRWCFEGRPPHVCAPIIVDASPRRHIMAYGVYVKVTHCWYLLW